MSISRRARMASSSTPADRRSSGGSKKRRRKRSLITATINKSPPTINSSATTIKSVPATISATIGPKSTELIDCRAKMASTDVQTSQCLNSLTTLIAINNVNEIGDDHDVDNDQDK